MTWSEDQNYDVYFFEFFRLAENLEQTQVSRKTWKAPWRNLDLNLEAISLKKLIKNKEFLVWNPTVFCVLNEPLRPAAGFKPCVSAVSRWAGSVHTLPELYGWEQPPRCGHNQCPREWIWRVSDMLQSRRFNCLSTCLLMLFWIKVAYV